MTRNRGMLLDAVIGFAVAGVLYIFRALPIGSGRHPGRIHRALFACG